MNIQNNGINKRDRLVDSAAQLFQQNGLLATSLADIAKHAEIPIGNVYYYFKTKDELALAAIDKRRQQLAEIYAALAENIHDPRERLIALTAYFDKQNVEYAKGGCSIGKIIGDMDVGKDVVAQTAVQIMADFVAWTGSQFSELGHNAEAKKHAISFMSAIQGAAVMAKTFQNPEIFSDEMARLVAWIENLPNKKIQLGKVGLRFAANGE